jgi:hypothetical protein
MSFVDVLLFVAASALAVLVFVGHLDSLKVYVCNSDVHLQVYVLDQYFVERERVAPVRHCSCPNRCPLHERAVNARASFVLRKTDK